MARRAYRAWLALVYDGLGGRQEDKAVHVGRHAGQLLAPEGGGLLEDEADADHGDREAPGVYSFVQGPGGHDIGEHHLG